MEKIKKQILNIIQRNFPVKAGPYQCVAEQIGSAQDEVIENVIQLKQAGIIRRIGANFTPEALGYTSTLVGAKVPAEQVDAFVAEVNALPGVSHNYGREHKFNIWFTLTMADLNLIDQTIARLKQDFNLEAIYSLPALKLFKIRVDFDLNEDNGDAPVKNGSCPKDNSTPKLPTSTDVQEQNQVNLLDGQIALVRQLQEDLPITAEPFELIGKEIGMAQAEVLQQIKQWKATGVIRRFGASIRHQRAGFSTNGMVVFSLPEDRIDTAGKLLADYKPVSHCYQRPSAPGWPYNLFAMTHCRNPEQLQNLVQQMVSQLEPEQYDVLLSTTEYKKTNVKFFLEQDMQTNSNNDQLFSQARSIIPGGVNSPVRAFGGVGGTPIFMDHAQGARLWDTNGKEYLDYVGSWGPCILGHAPEKVIAAVKQAAERGTSFGTATVGETSLAQRVIELMPNIEMLRLVNSGTEATMSALRLVRAFTKRDKIIKFAGCYHGHADSFLVRAGSGATTLGVPTSPGVPAATVADTLLAEFNDIDSVATLIEQHPDKIAAVFIEPVIGNAGVIPPTMEFLKQLREITQQAGTLLVFDEVMTGFRVAAGGAQQLFDIKPDLTTLGKIIGGGLPIGAFGGRKEIMNLLAPAGPVYQAGTLSGNPLAVAAGLTTLNELNSDTYKKLESLADLLELGIRKNLKKLKLPYQYQRIGSMACLFFTDQQVANYDDALTCDTESFARYYHNMLAEGIYLPPSQFEAFFISTAHSQDDINRTISANFNALQSL